MGDNLLDDPWAVSTAASSSQLLPGLMRTSLSRRSSATNLSSAYNDNAAGTDVDEDPSSKRKKDLAGDAVCKTAAHPLRSVAGKGSFNGEATRPTLRRLVVNGGSGQAASSIWIGGGKDASRKSLDGWSKSVSSDQRKGKSRAVEVGKEQCRREGGKEVLVHPVGKNETLAGISLSYGISVAALRKANGMWSSDSLSLRPVLRIPLSLCNLPPSKRIEIESNRATVWEDGSTASSPISATTAPARSTSWGALAAARANGTALSETLASRASLEMSASGSSGAPSARTSLDLLASSNSGSSDGGGRATIRNVPSLQPSDPVGEYLASTNFDYGAEDSPLPSPLAEPLDDDGAVGIPDLPTRSRDRSATASSSASSGVAHTKRTLRIQTVPQEQLGFFSIGAPPDTARPRKPLQRNGTNTSSPTDTLSPNTALSGSLEGDISRDTLLANAEASIPSVIADHGEAFSPYSISAGLRSARLRQRSSASIQSGRSSPATRPSSPSLSRNNSRMVASPSPLAIGTPVRVNSPPTVGSQTAPLPTTGQSGAEAPDSPGVDKKKLAKPAMSRKGSVRNGDARLSRQGIGLGFGHTWSFGSSSDAGSYFPGASIWLNGGAPASKSISSSKPTSLHGGASGGTSSKWNTVRPGQPPPLIGGLRFLEDGPSALAGMLEAAIGPSLSGAPSISGTAASATLNGMVGQHARGTSAGDKVELDQLGRAQSSAGGAWVNGRGATGGTARKVSRWGLWDDLEQEARDAGL